MSDENSTAQEIPADDERAGAALTAIDRTERDPLAAAPIGVALSVLFWIDGDDAPVPER